MEKRRVVITGLGTVNPLGNTAADSWAAAKAGRCGIGPITQFDTTDFKCKLAGEVKNFDPETVVDKKEARKMARFTLLALAAAAEAIADSGLNTEAEAKNIGVVLSSGIGGLRTPACRLRRLGGGGGVRGAARHGEEVARTVLLDTQPVLGLRDAPQVAGAQYHGTYDGGGCTKSTAALGIGHFLFVHDCIAGREIQFVGHSILLLYK